MKLSDHLCLPSHNAVVAAIIVLFASGCSTTITIPTYTMTPIPATGMTVEQDSRGQPMLYSVSPNLAMGLMPSAPRWRNDVRPSFHLIVANLSDYPVPFGTDNIRAHYNGQPLKIIPPETLVAEAQARQNSIAEARADAQRESRRSQRWATLLRRGSQMVDSDTAAILTSGALGLELGNELIEKPTIDMLAEAEENASAYIDLMMQNYEQIDLKEHIISVGGPSENIGGGLFYLDIPSSTTEGGSFEIFIDVDGEFHDFRFELVAH